VKRLGWASLGFIASYCVEMAKTHALDGACCRAWSSNSSLTKKT